MQSLKNNEIQSGADTYSSAISEAVNYTRWILDECSPYLGNRVLEVGLGHGSYRQCLPPQVKYYGVDIDDDSVAQAKARHPQDIVFKSDIADSAFLQKLENEIIDSVLCINVLEHIDKHKDALQNLMTVIRPGGHLFLFVPAFNALYTDLDRLAGHHRRYRKEDILALLPKNSRIIKNKYFNPIGGLGWWVNGLVKHDSLNSGAVNGQITVFDKYILPISRSLDPLTAPFFGQSLIAVLQRI
ncbi:MAG: class I SAM-dependent methyltransferase [Candidatus Obscuribacterales bacterium]|nr:class I SAM-dependent methyltransferase [Candidatus Obscuribacterales bacterium]